MTFQELQSLGKLRSDLRLGGDVQMHPRRDDQFPYVWLQTQDSKATAFSRLLFAMKPGMRASRISSAASGWRPSPTPWPSREPGRSRSARRARPDHARATQGPPPDAQPGGPRLGPQRSPGAARAAAIPRREPGAPSRIPRHGGWSSSSPLIPIPRTRESWRAAAFFLNRLLKARPEGLVEGVRILIAHPDAVTSVMTRYGYTDPDTDRRLPGPGPAGGTGTGRKARHPSPRGPRIIPSRLGVPVSGNGHGRVGLRRFRRRGQCPRETGTTAATRPLTT